MWIAYVIGLVFLIMLVKSIILKPILFKEKWQAGIGYGIPAVLCFLLFIILIYSDYSSEQMYFKDQNTRYTASNWHPPTVSGSVTPSNPASSQYVSIPIPQNKNLEDGLLNLQNDLNALEKDVVAKTASTAASTSTTAYAASASNDPKKQPYMDNNGKPAIIGDTDSKIYHLPGDPYYDKEMQKLSNNVYFRTIEEAETAGYRAIKG
jgi:apolipoprotein N-acyltransferase